MCMESEATCESLSAIKARVLRITSASLANSNATRQGHRQSREFDVLSKA